MLSIIPLELKYNILIRISDVDIMNFCLASGETKLICGDNILWMNKLDRDFPSAYLAASIYVKEYPHSDSLGYSIYKRWKNFNMEHMTYMDNIDVIIYNIDLGWKPTMSQNEKLLEAVIHKGSLNLLKHFVIRYVFPIESSYDIHIILYLAVQFDRLDIFEWVDTT